MWSVAALSYRHDRSAKFYILLFLELGPFNYPLLIMRRTLLRLAESVTAKPLNLREASSTLLPPKPYVRRSSITDSQYLTDTTSGFFVAYYVHIVYSQLKCEHWAMVTSNQVCCIFYGLFAPQPELARHPRVQATSFHNESSTHNWLSVSMENVPRPTTRE